MTPEHIRQNRDLWWISTPTETYQQLKDLRRKSMGFLEPTRNI